MQLVILPRVKVTSKKTEQPQPSSEEDAKTKKKSSPSELQAEIRPRFKDFDSLNLGSGGDTKDKDSLEQVSEFTLSEREPFKTLGSLLIAFFEHLFEVWRELFTEVTKTDLEKSHHNFIVIIWGR